MRFIQKGEEPETLKAFKALASPPNWIPSYDGLNKDRKTLIKSALFAKQKGLCCYCECRLVESESHIEHLKPQHQFEELALDYGNMLCSCMSDVQKGEPLHCGMAKADWYDANLLITPLDPGCEAHFRFLGDGRIIPSEMSDRAAAETIRRLRLDDCELTEKRKVVLDAFLDPGLTDEERERFLADYLAERGASPSEFISAVRSVFG